MRTAPKKTAMTIVAASAVFWEKILASRRIVELNEPKQF
jgi:hypothetical protein